MRNFIIALLACLGLATPVVVLEQVTSVHAASYTCSGYQQGSTVHRFCTPVGGGGNIQSYQVVVQCTDSDGPVTTHYGNRVWVSNGDSHYTCPSTQPFVWNAWAQVYL